MLVFNSSKKLLLLLKIRTSINPKTHHPWSSGLQKAYCFESIHPSPPPTSTPSSSSLCVSFLVDACGLSPDQAVRTASKMKTVISNEDTRPRSVIDFLETTGFSKTHISKLIFKYPKLLFSDVEKTLKPKIKLFQDLGLSDSNVADLIVSKPHMMRRNIENHIKPILDSVRSIVETDENLIKTIMCSGFLLTGGSSHFVQPNIDLLRKHGVPNSLIMYLFMNSSRIFLQKTVKMEGVIERVVRFGFKPQDKGFMIAVEVICSMNKSTWDSKIDMLKGLGWCEDQIFDCFRKMPQIFKCSSKKLKEAIEFYAKNLNWDAPVFSKCPILLCLSLKGRIIPRLRIYNVLVSNKMIVEVVTTKQLIPMLKMNKKDFQSKYVTKYQDEVPDLFEKKKKTCTGE